MQCFSPHLISPIRLISPTNDNSNLVTPPIPIPRQGVPCLVEAFVLCLAVLQPLPFRDRHGSFLTVIAPLTRPAPPTPILQASSRHSTSCSSRQPQFPRKREPRCCHSPFRSLHGRFSPPQAKLPQLHRECPTLRGLTTLPFAPSGRRRFRASSVVRSPNRTSNIIAGKPHIEKKLVIPSVGRAVSHETPIPLAYGPIPAAAHKLYYLE